jgi:hypothetical protein
MATDAREETTEEFFLSIVRGDVLFRLQRRIGLIPADGLGLARRAIFWSLFAWLPVAAWAWLEGRAMPPFADEPLLGHFGVQARCLIAIPLLILAEGPAHAMTRRILPHFVRSGLVSDSQIPAFREALAGAARVRDATLPWVALIGAVLALNVVAEYTHRSHEVTWGVEQSAGTPSLGFGALWFLYVARPIHLALLVAWFWRIVLVGSLLRRIARIELALVPTHPDRAAGLGFLEEVPKIFAPVVFAISAVLASRWGHDVVYHGVHVKDLRLQMGAFVILATLLFLSPVLAFVPLLAKTKRQALLDYAALVGRHGRLVRDRWIGGQAVGDDALLDAPEIGPVADTGPIYDAVASMHVLLIGKAAVLPLLLAAALPLVPVLAIEIPITTILGALAKAII